MLKSGDIVYISSDSYTTYIKSRIYHIKEAFFVEGGKNIWYVCDLYFKDSIHDKINLHLKSSHIDNYIDRATDPIFNELETRCLHMCEFWSEDRLAKFLLERER